MSDLRDLWGEESALLPPAFSITILRQDDRVRVAPCGELDIATAGQLESEVAKLVSAGCPRIIIDLGRVEFIDSTGLQALLTAELQARSDHWVLAIVQGPPAVRRLFELTATLDYLPFISEAP